MCARVTWQPEKSFDGYYIEATRTAPGAPESPEDWFLVARNRGNPNNECVVIYELTDKRKPLRFRVVPVKFPRGE